MSGPRHPGAALRSRAESAVAGCYVLAAGGLLALGGLWHPGSFALRNTLLGLAVLLLACRPGLITTALREPTLWCAAGFCAVAAASLLNAGAWSWQSFMIPLNWLTWLGLGWLAAWCLPVALSSEDTLRVRRVWLLPAAGVTLWALGVWLLHATGLRPAGGDWDVMGRLTLSYLAPTRLAAYLAGACVLAAGVFAQARSARWRLIAALLAGGTFVLLVLSGTRAALLAALVCAVAAVLVSMDRRRLVQALVAGAVVLALVAGLLAAGVAPQVSQRLFGSGDDVVDEHADIVSTALPSRLGIWSVSLGGFAEHPILGVGFGRFAEFYAQAAPDYFASHEVPRQAHVPRETSNAHNLVVHVLTETGILGLITLLALLATALWACLRSPLARPAAWAGLAVLLALQLNNNLPVWRVGYPFMLWLGLGVGLARAGRCRADDTCSRLYPGSPAA